MIDVARTSLGRISVDQKAFARLVHDAAEGADGTRVVRSRRTLQITIAEDGTPNVELAISASHGTVLPELGRRVQERVAEVLRATLGVADVRVDVTVESIHSDGTR